MTPVGGRPSRRLRGQDKYKILVVQCFCGVAYEVPAKLLKTFECTICHTATRNVPEDEQGPTTA